MLLTFCRTGRCRTRWTTRIFWSDMKSKALKKTKKNSEWYILRAKSHLAGLLYLSFLQGSVNFLVLLELLQLGLDENLPDVHDLLHGQSQPLHRIAELLLQGTDSSRLGTKAGKRRIHRPATTGRESNTRNVSERRTAQWKDDVYTYMWTTHPLLWKETLQRCPFFWKSIIVHLKIS